MRFGFHRSYPALLAAGVFLWSSAALAQGMNGGPASYPQIVRISYAEGDVRVSRGKQADKLYDSHSGETTGWEKAATGIPLASGYSLVTGNGRAEIELEDGSVVYLAENSVLKLGELSSTAGIPFSQVALLSGTATLDLKLTNEGEHFIFSTPTDSLGLAYPQSVYVRVDSYLDAMVVTPQRELKYMMAGEWKKQPAGRSSAFSRGKRILLPPQAMMSSYSAWDAWVEARVGARDTADSEALKQSGLKEPLPGLAALTTQGRFFDCQPYGTCWQPSKGWDGKSDWTTTEPSNASQAAAASTGTTPSKPKKEKLTWFDKADAYEQAHPHSYLYTEDYTFPCADYVVQDLIARDPVTGKEKIIDSRFDSAFLPIAAYTPRWNYWGWGYDFYWNQYAWQWTVCHAGSWIRWQHHYVWVVGRNMHHHCPVRWVKHGHEIGYVPVHPHDRPGKPPVNLKNGLITVTDKKAGRFTRVDLDPGKSVKVLTQPPREFRRSTLQPLTRADAPHPMGHAILAEAASAHTGTPPRDSSVTGSPARSFLRAEHDSPIEFNRKSQGFVVERTDAHRGHDTQVMFAGKPEAIQSHIEHREGIGYATTVGRAARGDGGASAWANSSNSGFSATAGSSPSSASSPSFSGGGGAASYGGGAAASFGGGGGSSAAPSSPPSTPSGGRGDSTPGSR